VERAVAGVCAACSNAVKPVMKYRGFHPLLITESAENKPKRRPVRVKRTGKRRIALFRWYTASSHHFAFSTRVPTLRWSSV